MCQESSNPDPCEANTARLRFKYPQEKAETAAMLDQLGETSQLKNLPASPSTGEGHLRPEGCMSRVVLVHPSLPELLTLSCVSSVHNVALIPRTLGVKCLKLPYLGSWLADPQLWRFLKKSALRGGDNTPPETGLPLESGLQSRVS